MNNLARFTILSGAFLCAFTTNSQAAPWGIVAGENMVMLPPSAFPAAPAPAPVAPAAAPADADTENMVMLPQEAPKISPVIGSGYVEAGANVHNVSNNQGDWFGQFVTGQVQVTEKDLVNAHVLHQEAFHEKGEFVAMGDRHTIDDKWSTDVSAGMGSGASFLPRFRADAALNRTWLEGHNLVTTVGTTWMKASQIYSSVGMFVGANYYFSGPWIAQLGLRTDRSTPGGVFATSGTAALSYGYNKRFLLTGRVGYGREAYQLVGVAPVTNAFNSHNFGLNWRQWIGNDWGFNVASEYYTNPSYNRTGGTLSFFKEF